MKNEIKCDCSKAQLIKKGFNGTNAVVGLFVGMAFSVMIIHFYFSNHPMSVSSITDVLSQPEDVFSQSAIFIFAGLIPIAGVFAGTIGMNTILKVCIDCKKIEPLILPEKEEHISL